MDFVSQGVKVTGLKKSFGATKALRGIDLEVKPGQVLGLLGPNGAGKTTAVRILSTLLQADGGTATVAGHDVARHPERVRQAIGLTGQYAAIDSYLTGQENLVMVGRLYGLSKSEATSRAQRLLKRFDLAAAGGRTAATYSGGMSRRLDLAASLIGEPEVLFLDEPTTGLDPRSRREMWQVIRELVSGGMTLLLTTQYLDEADELADHIAVIDHGKVVAKGTATQLKRAVGGDRLEVRPTDPAERNRAAKILKPLARGTVETNDAGFLLVPIDDPATLAEAIRRLDKAGIKLADVGLRHPTLDHVFLHLTGRKRKGRRAVPKRRKR
jgi:daunorubicin resistance ABC transporter ATP-binding subunit